MAKQTRELFEKIKEDPKTMGAIEAAVEGVKEAMKAFAPGLTLDKTLHDVGAEIKQMGAHGAHELAAAIFNGSAFVMYPRHQGQRDDEPQHGLPPEAMKQPEMEQDRGGRDM